MIQKKIVAEMAIILILASFFGLGLNFSLLKMFWRGGFRQGFVSLEKYPSLSFITLEEAEELFVQSQAIFVDSRPRLQYLEGHILGAINIPYDEFNEAEVLKGGQLSFDKTLVVYCDASECQSSLALSKALNKMGFTEIMIFFGGWEEWKKRGLPTESGDGSK